MKNIKCCKRMGKFVCYIFCFIVFMLCVNNSNKTVKCMQPGNFNFLQNMRGAEQRTMSLFECENNSLLSQAVVNYEIDDNNTMNLELRGVENPEGLDIYVVPVIKGIIQPRVILKRTEDVYKGVFTLPEMEEDISLHFYFQNPQEIAEHNTNDEFRNFEFDGLELIDWKFLIYKI